MIPLHIHSDCTLLKGTIPIDKLVDKAVEYRLPALAITGTNAMNGVIQFEKLLSKKR